MIDLVSTISQVSVIRTLYYNLKLFNFLTAVRIPLVIGKRTRVELHRGDMILPERIEPGMITYGIGGSSDLYHFESRKSYLGARDDGRICFKGRAHFAVHSSCYAHGGTIVFGDRFSCNVGCKVSSVNRVEFGRECLLGGEVVVRDSDGHSVFNFENTGVRNDHPKDKPVMIGNHVWIGNKASVLKGVTIADGCIVGYGSIVTKSISLNNCIIAGIPGRIVKENASWER